MSQVKTIFFYFIKDYKNRFFKYFKRILLLMIIFSLVIFFISLPKSFEFYQTAGLKYATFDVTISTGIPFTENDLNRIRNLSVIEDIIGETRIGGNGLLINNTQLFPTIIFVNDMIKASKLIYSEKLLLDGEFKSGYAVIDWLLADALHAKVGNRIAVNFSGSIITYTISGIMYSGRETFFTIIVQFDNKTKKLLSDFLLKDNPYLQNRYFSEKPLYDYIYLKLKKSMSSEEIANLLSSALSIKIEPIQVRQRLDMLNSISKDVLRNWQENSFYQLISWGSILLYGVLVFRDSVNKFEERKRDLALLLALGLGIKSVTFMIIVELFMIFALVTVISIFINIYYYKYIIKFIILQGQVMFDIFYSSMLINAIIISLSTVLIIVLLYRLSLVKILNEG